MARHISTELYDAFIAVAETGGFTAAVDRLNRTQTTISQQIKRLETLMETDLFIRTSRCVELTAAGQSLLPYARKILLLNEQAACAAGGAEEKLVRIGLPDVYAEAALPRFTDALYSIDPRIAPIVHCDNSKELLDRFSAGELDIVLAARHPGAAIGRLICTERLDWVAASHFQWDESQRLPVVLPADGCIFRQQAFDALQECGPPWDKVYVGQCSAAITPSLRQGIGLGVSPSRTIPPGLVPVGEKFGLPALKCISLDLHVGTGLQARFGDNIKAALSQAAVEAFRDVRPVDDVSAPAERATADQNTAHGYVA